MTQQITKNFWINEFFKTPDLALVLGIQEERLKLRLPITINSNTAFSAKYTCNKKQNTYTVSPDIDIPVYGKDFCHNRDLITLDYFKNAEPNIKAVIIALFQCGFHEAENNNTPFGEFYKMNYNPWCAMFLHWCWKKAGVIGKIKYGLASSRESYKNIPVQKNDIVTLVSGDGMFWGYNGKPSGHTAMCAYNDWISETVFTIEGNSGDSVYIRKYSYNNLSNKIRTFLGGGNHVKYTTNIDLFSAKVNTSVNNKTT